MNKLLVTLLSCLTLISQSGYTYYYGCTKDSGEEDNFRSDNKLFSVNYNIANHMRFMIRDINNLFLDEGRLKNFGLYREEIKEIARFIEKIAIILLQNGCCLTGINESLEALKHRIFKLQQTFNIQRTQVKWKQVVNIEKCFINIYYLLIWCDQLIEANNALYNIEHKINTEHYSYIKATDAIYVKYKNLSNKDKKRFGWLV